MSISNYLEQQWLQTIRGGGNGTSYTAPATIYAKLHLGDPGEDGTANAAANTARVAVGFAAPVNPAGTMALSSGGAWVSVSATETYGGVSLWDDPTVGNCLGTGLISPTVPVNAGDNFNLATLGWTLD